MRERLAAVGRLVDAVSPRHALAVARFAAADPEKIGVRLRDGDVADRERTLILENRLESGPVVRCFPHAAVRGGDVIQRWIGFVDREVGDASRHRCGTNRPEVQRIEWLAGGRCGGALLGSADERSSGEHDGCGERHANQSIQLHRQRPPGSWTAAIIATAGHGTHGSRVSTPQRTRNSRTACFVAKEGTEHTARVFHEDLSQRRVSPDVACRLIRVFRVGLGFTRGRPAITARRFQTVGPCRHTRRSADRSDRGTSSRPRIRPWRSACRS